MSQRFNNGSHYQNHQRAAEMHQMVAHAHLTAATHYNKQDHQSGHEHSRQALEHSQQAFLHSQEAHQQADRHAEHPSQEEVAALAHQLWIERGSPEGSPEEDWNRALDQLQLHPVQS